MKALMLKLMILVILLGFGTAVVAADTISAQLDDSGAVLLSEEEGETGAGGDDDEVVGCE